MDYAIETIDWCFSPSTKIPEETITEKWAIIFRKLSENKDVSIEPEDEMILIKNKEKTSLIALSKQNLHIHLELKDVKEKFEESLQSAHDLYLRIFKVVNDSIPIAGLDGSVIILRNIKIENGRDNFNKIVQLKNLGGWTRKGIKLSLDDMALMLEFANGSEGKFLFDAYFKNLTAEKIFDETNRVLTISDKTFKELMGI